MSVGGGEEETKALRQALLGIDDSTDATVMTSDDVNETTTSATVESAKANPTEECAICFDELSSGELMALPCGHVFHTTCVSNWLARHPFCPHCRINVISLRPDDDDNSILNTNISDDGGSRHLLSNANSAVFFVADENVRNDAAAPAVVGLSRCRVCGRTMADGDVHLFVLSCSHRFHRECLGASLLRSPHCPDCRAPVSYIHRVNDPQDVLREDNDVARLGDNRVRLQAWRLRREALFFERKRRWGCMLIVLLVLLAAGMTLFLWISGRLSADD